MTTDTRIESFRQAMERLSSIPGQLQTIAIILARADELPGIMARCTCRLDGAQLREEQAAFGHPLGLRLRLSQIESELRQGFSAIGDQLRAAIDAATAHAPPLPVGWMPPGPFHSPEGIWRNLRCTEPCRPLRAPPDDLYSSGRHGWRWTRRWHPWMKSGSMRGSGLSLHEPLVPVDTFPRLAICSDMVTELNEADFQAEVIDSKLPVLVDFWSEQCIPCKNLVPVLDQVAEDLAGRAKVVKMDAFANMRLASSFGVRSVPNLLFFKNGEVKDQFVGANITRDQLRAKLEALM